MVAWRSTLAVSYITFRPNSSGIRKPEPQDRSNLLKASGSFSESGYIHWRKGVFGFHYCIRIDLIYRPAVGPKAPGIGNCSILVLVVTKHPDYLPPCFHGKANKYIT